MSLPRYFVPHAASPAEPVQPEPSAVLHAVDTFRLHTPYLGEREWLVCTDIQGHLVVLPASARDQLPASVQAQLTHHELTSGRAPRLLTTSGLFLFSVELVEHPADAEGINDPVYLYGTLVGPWPGASPQRLPGQLTVTRADVLAGLVQGAGDALRYAPDPESKTAPRSYHALLPGDRPERLAAGEGLVLAYPAVPLDMQAHHAANDPWVAHILHAVLTQLQEDVRAHGGEPEVLARMELPVPSRLMAIAELEARGYEVKGEVATPRRNHPGLVNRLAEWLRAEKVRVPPEAQAPEFIALASRALEALPGWPSETERVLRALTRPGDSTPAKGVLPVTAPRIPAAPPRLPPRAPPAPARPGDWMQDFLDAHARPGGSKPTLTRAPPPAPPAAPPPRRSDWMSDFTSSPPAPRRPEPAAPEPAKKPGWMSDFED